MMSGIDTTKFKSHSTHSAMASLLLSNNVPFHVFKKMGRWKSTILSVLRMLRDINVSVIAYLDDLLIVGSTREECLTNLKKTMELLVKLGFKLNLEKNVLEPTQSITFLGLQIDSLSMKLLV
ncbi:hypothetical protein ACTFIZ_007941 [Dictyostelium cf. discoideum]